MKSIRQIGLGLLIGVWGWAGGAAAEPIDRLELGEAMALAGGNTLLHAEFREAESYYRQRGRERWRRLYLPAVSVEYTERNGALSSTEQEKSVEARLDYPLYSGGRDRASYRAAVAAGKAGLYGRELTLNSRRHSAAELYLQLASTIRGLKSQQFAVERAGLELENARKRSEIGLRAELEVLQAKVALAEEELLMREERNRREELTRQLSHLIGREVTPETRLEEEPDSEEPEQPLEHYLEWSRSHHPLLLQAESEQEQARQEVANQRSVRRPELLLSAGYSEEPGGDASSSSVGLSLIYRFGGHRAALTRTNASSNLGSQSSSSSPGGDITTTTYGVTFFDYSDRSATAESALFNARLEQVRAARRSTELREERRREIRSLYNELGATRMRGRVAGMRVDKDEAELEAYRKAFAAGAVRYDQVLERQTLLNRNKLEEINARLAVQLARLNLLAAAGLPLDPS